MVERLEVQRAVAAPAAEIFAVLGDPRGHVAIDSSGMLMEASGEVVAQVGDTFVVHMDREALNDYPLGLYDVTVEIVAFEPDREIAWTVRGQLNLGHVYGYRLEPIEEGTLVTSYYDWSAAEQNWKDAAIFPVIPESALRATLGILARTVAPGKPRPALPDEGGRRLPASDLQSGHVPVGGRPGRDRERRSARPAKVAAALPAVTLPAGATEWPTITFDVLVRCPSPLPVQFLVSYTISGKPATAQLDEFPDLGQVAYSGCPAPQ
jgi:hypothetical protein